MIITVGLDEDDLLFVHRRPVATDRMDDFKLLVGDPGPGQWTPPPEYTSTGDYLTSDQADSGYHGLKTSEVEVAETAQDEVLRNEKADVSAWSQSGEVEEQDGIEARVEQLLQLLNITMSEIRLYNIAGIFYS